MNNIKNKLVHKILAVIRSEKSFVPQYQHPKNSNLKIVLFLLLLSLLSESTKV
jgi:hypothetical protein